MQAALLLSLAAFAAAQSLDQAIARAVQSIEPRLIETRRDFHMYPELSNREERTARTIAARLRQLGFDEVKIGVARHGVVALLRGAKPGPVVAWRADMDALPVEETLDVPYKSRHRGVKHACGHDVHMAVALGIAEVLAGMRAELAGAVKFLFQPAEEGPPEGEPGGALQMIREGALENPRPAAIFGLHVGNTLPAGKVGYVAGPMLASSDQFQITVRGKRAHAAWPHQGVDAVTAASHCVLALQTIRSRRTDPVQPLVLTIGMIHGGNRHNILAEEVRMEGTLRTFDEGVRESVRTMMKETLAGCTAGQGATWALRWGHYAYPVTANPRELAAWSARVLERALGAAQVIETPPVMGAEDFSYYQREIPGFFYWLGGGNAARGLTAGNHTAEFDIDESALAVGVRTGAALLIEALEKFR